MDINPVKFYLQNYIVLKIEENILLISHDKGKNN